MTPLASNGPTSPGADGRAGDGATSPVAKLDCHVHTRGSYDSVARLDRVLAAASDAGLDGLVVTDHDCLTYSLAAVERAPMYDLVAIPGVEVSSADGHVLAIGVESRPPSGESFATTVAKIRAADGIAVVPHPFQRSRHGVSAATITDCDGVEVFNAHTLTGLRNRQAARFATARAYPRFAGSDAHKPETVGRAYTEVGVDPETATADDYLAAMRAGRVRAAGERVGTARYVRKLARNARLTSKRRLRNS